MLLSAFKDTNCINEFLRHATCFKDKSHYNLQPLPTHHFMCHLQIIFSFFRTKLWPRLMGLTPSVMKKCFQQICKDYRIFQMLPTRDTFHVPTKSTPLLFLCLRSPHRSMLPTHKPMLLHVQTERTTHTTCIVTHTVSEKCCNQANKCSSNSLQSHLTLCSLADDMAFS